MSILELLRQRRVWAGIVGLLTIALTLLKITYQIEVPALTDLLTVFGGALADLIIAGLAVWSFLKPKQ